MSKDFFCSLCERIVQVEDDKVKTDDKLHCPVCSSKLNEMPEG